MYIFVGLCILTVCLLADLVGLELHPRPVEELVGQDGREKDFGDGAGEGLVELSLYRRKGIVSNVRKPLGRRLATVGFGDSDE